MPRDETRHAFSDDEKGKVLDPNPERRRHVTETLYKFLTKKITAADLAGIPRKKLSRLAETGYIKYKYGRYAEAMQIFKVLATLDSTNAYYHTALGGVYQKLGKFVDSVIAYTRSLRLNPKDLCPHVNRGEIYLRHKNYKKAADDFRSAILMDPDGRNLWANRARSLVIALKRSLDIRKRMQQAASTRGAGQRGPTQSAGGRPPVRQHPQRR